MPDAEGLGGSAADSQSPIVDLLYVGWNRLAFTQESFELLLRNTEWELVRELVVWDDGSTDGTAEYLREAVARVPAPTRLVETSLRSPVAVMARFIEEAAAPLVAKIDNDVLVPPGWLSESLAVLQAHPELSLLGIEAIQPHAPNGPERRSYASATFVSGLALYRRAAFARTRPAPSGRWFGFEEWQRAQKPHLGTGWIAPALPLVLLDRLPLEPWRSLTNHYVNNGWQRRWPAYAAASTLWQWWTPVTSPEQPPPLDTPFDVVILSANANNLVACVNAVLDQEPGLDPSNIIVVDDGARKAAEARLPAVRWVQGEKPFIFARNANLGIAASQRDVILLNDDALLITPTGFRHLAERARSQPEVGILGSGVRGVVGNPNQTARGRGFRAETRVVCFVAAYIRRDVLEALGPLDERFVGYGYEDDDYSQRALDAGYTLAIDDGCVVDHNRLPPTFRRSPDYLRRFAENRKLYGEKMSVRHAGLKGASAGVLCVMRVKNEAAHIGDVLERALPLCSGALVFDDHSDDGTIAVCRSFGDRVRVLESPFIGLDEARDKNHLLGPIAGEAPAWVFWIDGDEALERNGAARLRAEIDAAPAGMAIFSLRVAYIWDEDDRVRIDGIWGRFRRPSLFRWRGQRTGALHFPEAKPPNFHCGNVPRGIVGATGNSDVRLKHYGYADPQIRQRKYVWYTTVDPNNASEDHYRHLASIPGARHAPGPPVLVPWSE
jgi:GT2 family glycosyltransferase